MSNGNRKEVVNCHDKVKHFAYFCVNSHPEVRPGTLTELSQKFSQKLSRLLSHVLQNSHPNSHLDVNSHYQCQKRSRLIDNKI
jgi:predicted RNase H-related nuclease YkuK (DUF458 family)